MARYPHFITKAAYGQWPNVVVCVDCQTVIHEPELGTARRREELVSWHAERLHYGTNGYYLSVSVAGGAIVSWWNYLLMELQNHSSAMIVSYQCGRIWTLLDLWGVLENGHATIAGSAGRKGRVERTALRRVRPDGVNDLHGPSAGSLSRLLRQDAGALVTEDPPCIARFVLRGCPATFTWLDCRNHGVELDGSTAPGSSRAAALRSWVLDYTELLRKTKLGAIRATAGQQAMHGWRHSYYNGGVYVHTDPRATECERASYCGGRCECFRVGAIEEPTLHIDVRSIYPAICSDDPLPVRLLAVHAGFTEQEYRRLPRDVGAIATVTVETSEPAYPAHYQGVTVWPVGRFRTSLAGPELADAVAHGRVAQWHDVCLYELQPCLKGFVDAVYPERLYAESYSNHSLAQSIKKLLVCLPGKFAQRLKIWHDRPDLAAPAPWGSDWGSENHGLSCRYRYIAGLVQQDCDCGWGGEAVPAIASWVTSAGRMILLRAIRVAGWQHVHYCDTDSLILDQLGYLRLYDKGMIHACKLGGWQLRGSYHRTVIYGIKHYAADGKVTCSGLPRGSCTDAGDGVHYWYTESPAQAALAGERPTAERVLRTYLRSGQYIHGKIGADGRVQPLVFRGSQCRDGAGLS